MRRLGAWGLRALARCNPQVVRGGELGIRAAIRFQDALAVIKRDGAGPEKHTNRDPPSRPLCSVVSLRWTGDAGLSLPNPYPCHRASANCGQGPLRAPFAGRAIRRTEAEPARRCFRLSRADHAPVNLSARCSDQRWTFAGPLRAARPHGLRPAGRFDHGYCQGAFCNETICLEAQVRAAGRGAACRHRARHDARQGLGADLAVERWLGVDVVPGWLGLARPSLPS